MRRVAITSIICLGVGAAGAVAAAQPGPEGRMQEPLLAPWTGPYGGVPPFQSVKVAAFGPALDAAMKEQLAEVERIAEDGAPPTFENTLAALERSGRTLRRVRTVFGVWTATLGSPEVRAVEREVAPKLAALDDRITQNEKLFRRIEAVYDGRETACKGAEQKRLAWRVHTRFVRAGARLDAAGKKRVAEINERLAALFTAFRQNVLADEEVVALVLSDEKDLAGLPPAVRSAAAAAATGAGQPGRWAILNTRSSVEPFLTFSPRRDLREKVWRAFVSRGDRGGDHDNKKVITDILTLRAERAKLLGYPTHAHWRVEDTMARTPERAVALMEAVWPAAVARVREEVADMKALAAKEGVKLAALEPWDYRYFAEKVRKAKYDVDQDEVKPYLQLERLREGMFWVAGQLFDFHFAPAKDVPVQHPDVRVWEVKDGGGRHVGLWYFDPWAREGKQSGAWMNAYRPQERLDGDVTPIVSNNANFVKARPGEPVLVSWDDAKTLFHEFGHALHGLSSNITYPSLGRVARDYAEFPSQLLERWLATPEVLHRFAVHFRTGEPMPDALVRKIERAGKFRQGFETVEYLSAALVDMRAHLAGGRPVEPESFERETLAALGMPREIVMRHRMPQFLHVFSGDGYSAGYYSYLWSDVLGADAYEAFTEAGGPYDRAVAARLKRSALSVGNTVDPAEAYRSFRGRDPDVRALMRRRGFPESGAAAAGP